jgi:hypothetical protein
MPPAPRSFSGARNCKDCEVVIARVCKAGSKFWIELSSDGESKAIYRFDLTIWKYGLLPESAELFKVCMINFLELWMSGDRSKFGDDRSAETFAYRHGWYRDKAIEFMKEAKSTKVPLGRVFLHEEAHTG